MAATCTPGITLARDGRFFIDKRYRGVRIGMRVGAVDQQKPSNGCEPRWRRLTWSLPGRLHVRASPTA
jgi:hypothetical protein